MWDRKHQNTLADLRRVGVLITTVAGRGTMGYGGDGGPATSARLQYPNGLALDAAGNLYIADTDNSRIVRSLPRRGVITTVAGNGTAGYSGDNGPAISAELNYPYAVALDGGGNLYISDASNNHIRQLSTATGRSRRWQAPVRWASSGWWCGDQC
jgi:sugar lactone lactonase YvrE